jgi:hypothetical protein
MMLPQVNCCLITFLGRLMNPLILLLPVARRENRKP